MPRALTDRQAGVLRAIVGLAVELGRLPTWREIGARCGLGQTSGVTCHMLALARKGWLAYAPVCGGANRPDVYRVLGLRMTPAVTADAAGDALRGVLGPDAGGDCPLPGLVAIEED